MSTTLLQLEQLVSEQTGDWLEVDTTTNIGAGVTIVSTSLTSYDGGQDSYFNDWWVYITEGNNIGVLRQVSAYTSATGTLSVRGANLAAEAGAVTIRLHRFNRDNITKAINRAIEQLYPVLFKPVVDNEILVTNNILPNAHMEDWAATTAPDFWAVTNSTALATTTAGLFRGGTKSAKVTASAADGYLALTSNNYPRLLDLMGRTVNFYAWAYPEVLDDAFLTIYTLKADGTAQTLNSTTTCPATKWSLLSLENQALNDDLVSIEFRLRVHTNAKYTYFDDVIAVGMNLEDYVIPGAFANGTITSIRRQTSGEPTIPCYELRPRHWSERVGFDVNRYSLYTASSSLYSRLRLYDFPSSYYRLQLQGYAPFGTLSADTSTIDLEGEKLNLIVAKATEILYRTERGPVSSQDKGRYSEEIARWSGEVAKLTARHGMMPPSSLIRTGR